MTHRKPRDSDRTSKLWCKLGLALSWIVGIGATVTGSVLLYYYQYKYDSTLTFAMESGIPMSRTLRELLPLAINIFVTLLCECMGYIHTCSLRWSLQREGRLEFNTNLRLLTSARHNRSNAWYANVVYLVGIILSYVSTSMIFLYVDPGLSMMLDDDERDANYVFVSGIAIVLLGGGLVLQAIVTTWALIATDIPCWSAHPLEVARECMHENDGHCMHHRIGRCMMGVHLSASPDAQDVFPQTPQRPMITAHHTVRWVFALLIMLPLVCALWGGVTYAEIVHGDANGNYNGVLGSSWTLLPWFDDSDTDGGGRSDSTPFLNLTWTQDYTEAAQAASLVIIALFQALITLSLHCAELLVNLSRDEAVYRKLEGPRGAEADINGSGRNNGGSSKNSFLAAVTAWQSVVLFCFKAAMHWMFGLAINVSYDLGVSMFPPQIFYLSALATALAIFGAALAFRRHRGYLPSTLGHIQTIVDIIDEWPDASRPRDGDAEASGSIMYWGHKADGETPYAPCYAGTSTTHRLPPPYPDRLYGGAPPAGPLMYSADDCYLSGATPQSEQQQPFAHSYNLYGTSMGQY